MAGWQRIPANSSTCAATGSPIAHAPAAASGSPGRVAVAFAAGSAIRASRASTAPPERAGAGANVNHYTEGMYALLTVK